MSFSSIIFSKRAVILSLAVILLSIYFNDEIEPLIKSAVKQFRRRTENNEKRKSPTLYTNEELAEFDGVKRQALYLAILGSIYDVTKGRKNYEKGASYNYFVGKDGSRSFITGKFNEEPNKEADHVLDFNCEELSNLKNWRDTYKSRYEYKGKHIGRYYDENGEATPYMKELRSKLKQCKIEAKLNDSEKRRLPPCNVEWTSTEGSRVWCTKDSGGISRDWVGVPRQLYSPGEDQPRCACINPKQDLSTLLLKEYEGCAPTSVSCVMLKE